MAGSAISAVGGFLGSKGESKRQKRLAEKGQANIQEAYEKQMAAARQLRGDIRKEAERARGDFARSEREVRDIERKKQALELGLGRREFIFGDIPGRIPGTGSEEGFLAARPGQSIFEARGMGTKARQVKIGGKWYNSTDPELKNIAPFLFEGPTRGESFASGGKPIEYKWHYKKAGSSRQGVTYKDPTTGQEWEEYITVTGKKKRKRFKATDWRTSSVTPGLSEEEVETQKRLASPAGQQVSRSLLAANDIQRHFLFGDRNPVGQELERRALTGTLEQGATMARLLQARGKQELGKSGAAPRAQAALAQQLDTLRLVQQDTMQKVDAAMQNLALFSISNAQSNAMFVQKWIDGEPGYSNQYVANMTQLQTLYARVISPNVMSGLAAAAGMEFNAASLLANQPIHSTAGQSQQLLGDALGIIGGGVTTGLGMLALM